METKELKEIMSWIKTTDLVEVCFKEDRRGFSFAAQDGGVSARMAAPSGSSYFSGNSETVVSAPGIGIFQWCEPGKPRACNEGGTVEPGDFLGLVDAGLGSKLTITAPCAGRLKNVMAEAGQGVEFGQPLFIIEENV